MGYVLLFLSGHRLCDEPGPVENGYRIGDEFWEGKNVTYKCNKGYRLRGPLVRVCNEIGNWTEEEPTCEGETPQISRVTLIKYQVPILVFFLFSRLFLDVLVDG